MHFFDHWCMQFEKKLMCIFLLLLAKRWSTLPLLHMSKGMIFSGSGRDVKICWQRIAYVYQARRVLWWKRCYCYWPCCCLLVCSVRESSWGRERSMPFISSSYDGSSRRSSGSSVSSLRGLDRFSATRKSSVYERPSTYSSSSVPTSTPKYSSLERLKNGNDNYLNTTNTTPSRFSRTDSSSFSPTNANSSTSAASSSPFGLVRRDSSASSYLR